jgi:hypothetical protein
MSTEREDYFEVRGTDGQSIHFRAYNELTVSWFRQVPNSIQQKEEASIEREILYTSLAST